jgi:hypothetical protein
MGFNTIKSTSERAEHLLGMVGTPIKPHLPAVSRILFQWQDQIEFLEQYRHFPKYTAPVFLGFNSLASIS